MILITDGRSSCDGSFTLLDGAVERIDLNLNGEVDLVVLDAGGFSCDESTSMYCGSAGCVVHFITSADYSYGYTRGWQIIRAKSDQPIILFGITWSVMWGGWNNTLLFSSFDLCG